MLGRRIAPRAPARWSLLRPQLAYALPFAGSSLLYVAQEYLPNYAVSACFDPATFALFAVASFHMPVTDMLYTPTSEVLMVDLGRSEALGDHRGAVRHWHEATERLAALLFPATVGAWLIGPLLLPLLFTARYSAAVPLFMLATAEMPLWILPCDAVLRAAGDTRFLFAFNAVRLGFTAALVVAGIHLFGVAGALGAGAASEAIAGGALLLRSRRWLRVPLREVLDWRALGRIATGSAIAAAPALALRWMLPAGSGLIVAMILVYLAAYLASRAALRRLPDQAGAAEAPDCAGQSVR